MKSKKTLLLLVFILGAGGLFAWKQWGGLGQQTISRPEVTDESRFSRILRNLPIRFLRKK